MNKYFKGLLIVLPLSLTLSACVVKVGGDDAGHSFSDKFSDREYDNRKKIALIQLNSSFSDVTNRLGVADFNEIYQNNGTNVQVLFYRTHRLHKDGITTKEECTYLHFENGSLIETGNGSDYDRNIKG